jgi:predicted alpha/beta-fold hydrolase
MQHATAFSGAPLIPGKSVWESYLALSNPMEHIEGNTKPMLLLNSEDDMVCLPANIREDYVQKCGNTMKCIMVRTRYGSHIAYREQLFG